MTPDQCRTARETVAYSQLDLSLATGVPLWFIAAFEDGADVSVVAAGFGAEIRKALQEAPVSFLEAFQAATSGENRRIVERAVKQSLGFDLYLPPIREANTTNIEKSHYTATLYPMH